MRMIWIRRNVIICMVRGILKISYVISFYGLMRYASLYPRILWHSNGCLMTINIIRVAMAAYGGQKKWNLVRWLSISIRLIICSLGNKCSLPNKSWYIISFLSSSRNSNCKWGTVAIHLLRLKISLQWQDKWISGPRNKGCSRPVHVL